MYLIIILLAYVCLNLYTYCKYKSKLNHNNPDGVWS